MTAVETRGTCILDFEANAYTDGHTVLDTKETRIEAGSFRIDIVLQDRGNEIILALTDTRLLLENSRGAIDTNSLVAKANDPSEIFGFMIQDGQMVPIIIALGSPASALRTSKVIWINFQHDVHA